jgi:hypothetical protein
MSDTTKQLTADQSRSKAEECRGLAQVAAKPEHRIMLQHIADTWERIARMCPTSAK